MLQFEEILIEHQSLLRMGVFLLFITVLLLLEQLWPRRVTDTVAGKYRQLSNLLLLGINIIALRICVPLAAFQVALFASEKNLGLFNLLDLPLILNIVLSILVFDLLIYLQHIAFHKVALLWKIHRVHHTDLQFDVTTGVRFHPFEIILSMLYKMSAVVILGPAAIAIIVYEVLLNAAALFTHSNINLSQRADAVLRKVIVTPDMHRVHHSVLKKETDSNYGNIFSFWDRGFRTYRDQPEAGHANMMIGLQELRDSSSVSLLKILKLPF